MMENKVLKEGSDENKEDVNEEENSGKSKSSDKIKI